MNSSCHQTVHCCTSIPLSGESGPAEQEMFSSCSSRAPDCCQGRGAGLRQSQSQSPRLGVKASPDRLTVERSLSMATAVDLRVWRQPGNTTNGGPAWFIILAIFSSVSLFRHTSIHQHISPSSRCRSYISDHVQPRLTTQAHEATDCRTCRSRKWSPWSRSLMLDVDFVDCAA